MVGGSGRSALSLTMTIWSKPRQLALQSEILVSFVIQRSPPDPCELFVTDSQSVLTRRVNPSSIKGEACLKL